MTQSATILAREGVLSSSCADLTVYIGETFYIILEQNYIIKRLLKMLNIYLNNIKNIKHILKITKAHLIEQHIFMNFKSKQLNLILTDDTDVL